MGGINIDNHCAPWPHGRFGEAITGLEKLLDEKASEQDIQSFIEANPRLLAEQLPHCNNVIPKPHFGSEYIPDFILPEYRSGGPDWYLVELEPCHGRLVTKSGLFVDRIRVAIEQVQNWRRWLLNHYDYARKRIEDRSLGLENISERPVGWIIVGRRKDTTPRFNELRNTCFRDHLIDVRTYDRLVEWAKHRANSLKMPSVGGSHNYAQFLLPPETSE